MYMQIYRILSALLSYPQADLIEALPEIRTALADDGKSAKPYSLCSTICGRIV